MFLTEINQRVRLNSSHTKMQKCYETSLNDSIKEQLTTDFFTLLLHSKRFHKQHCNTHYRKTDIDASSIQQT